VLTELVAGNGGPKSPSSGQYALHAKVFILDRQRVFIGSMNFDRRSMHLNTEVGVLIESPDMRARHWRASIRSPSPRIATFRR